MQTMTCGRSILQAATWPVIAVWAGLLVGASAGSASGASASAASEQGIFLDLTRALQNVAEMSTRRSRSPADPEVLTETSPGRGIDFVLFGVVIAAETRLALIQDAAASTGGPELLRVGGSLAGYRLTDIEEDQVTLEGQRGDRVILRLQSGGGAGGPASSEAVGRVEAPKPTDSGEFGWREAVREKEDRSAAQTQRDIQEKARALMERGVSIDPR